MELDRKRWVVIAAGVLANLCSGAAYSFSVFKGPLKARLGCSEPDVALAFSLSLAFLPVGMILAGRLADRGRSRPVVAFGGLVFGTGMFLAGYSGSVAWLYASTNSLPSALRTRKLCFSGVRHSARIRTISRRWPPHVRATGLSA